jgi:hypothetical protein
MFPAEITHHASFLVTFECLNSEILGSYSMVTPCHTSPFRECYSPVFRDISQICATGHQSKTTEHRKLVSFGSRLAIHVPFEDVCMGLDEK